MPTQQEDSPTPAYGRRLPRAARLASALVVSRSPVLVSSCLLFNHDCSATVNVVHCCHMSNLG
jgi:hypothetical protein